MSKTAEFCTMRRIKFRTPSESLATTDDETFENNFDQGASREYDQNDADNGSTRSTSSNVEPFATDDLGLDAVGGHCASQAAEVPAVPCPQIHTQQLDQPIKAPMKEVIPFLKDIETRRVSEDAAKRALEEGACSSTEDIDGDKKLWNIPKRLRA